MFIVPYILFNHYGFLRSYCNQPRRLRAGLPHRDAIANTAPGGTVDFDVTGTISLTSELVIDKDLTIDGPGAGLLTVSGGDVTRIFVINGGTDITISGLRITDGNGVGSFLSGGVGGAILLVSANSNVELNDCVF